jgi:putative hemolysin
VERQRDGSLVVEGTVSAELLREKYKLPIPESADYDTVAGYMLEVLGTVPKGGEVVSVGDYKLTVVDVDKTRISKVKVERTQPVAKPAPKRFLR